MTDSTRSTPRYASPRPLDYHDGFEVAAARAHAQEQHHIETRSKDGDDDQVGHKTAV